MAKCSFCGLNIATGTGKMFVKANGKITWLCSKKCEKNMGMGRESINMRWISKSKK